MFPPPNFALPGDFILITDTLPSPADFLLHRALSAHLKKEDHAVVVTISESLMRWKVLASKAGFNLTLPKSAALCKFIELDTLPADAQSSQTVLSRIHIDVAQALSSQPDGNALVIIDDLVSLEWSGVPLAALSRFLRAMRSLCTKNGAMLAIRLHVLRPTNVPTELMNLMLQLCSYHVEVRPLSSGRSGEVSGEIALHRGPMRGDVEEIPRSKATQYRLADYTVTYFERGTGAGVL